jgi:hypothetical protein
MSIFVDLHAIAAKLSSEDNRPICACCGKGRLVMIDERPHPNFGILSLFQQTLRCDSPKCGKLTIVRAQAAAACTAVHPCGLKTLGTATEARATSWIGPAARSRGRSPVTVVWEVLRIPPIQLTGGAF